MARIYVLLKLLHMLSAALLAQAVPVFLFSPSNFCCFEKKISNERLISVYSRWRTQSERMPKCQAKQTCKTQPTTTKKRDKFEFAISPHSTKGRALYLFQVAVQRDISRAACL